MREKKRLDGMIATDADLRRRLADISAYFELAREGEKVEPDLQREIGALQSEVDRLETETLLSGDNDHRNAIMTIHPGAGGVDSQDWADILLRMYLRWAERQGFSTEVNDYQPAEEAGVKSVTFTVNGQYASACSPAKSASTAWSGSPHSTRPSAATPASPASTCRPKSMRASKS